MAIEITQINMKKNWIAALLEVSEYLSVNAFHASEHVASNASANSTNPAAARF